MADGRVYRFVQLSDIHFGQEREGTLVVHEDVRKHLLADAAKLADARAPADLVIQSKRRYSGCPVTILAPR